MSDAELLEAMLSLSERLHGGAARLEKLPVDVPLGGAKIDVPVGTAAILVAASLLTTARNAVLLAARVDPDRFLRILHPEGDEAWEEN